MRLCRPKLTPLQRRSLGQVSGALLLLAGIQMAGHVFTTPGHPALRWAGLSSVVPVLLAVWTAGRYLSAEPDEFVRAVVVRAMMWGFAVTMVGDAILGVLVTAGDHALPLGLLNADLFLATTGIAFRLVQRGYR